MKMNKMGLMALVLFAAACFPPLHIKGELAPMPDDTGIVTDDSGETGETGEPCEEIDGDGDGWSAYTDCDDNDATINPDATEVCDGIDNDCNGDVDGDAVDKQTWYGDVDGDGYGDPATTVSACEQPAGYVADYTDCDDENTAIYPGAPETCEDPQDMNCDGFAGYEDGDGDGYAGCEECNDSDATINPDADEACNAIDDDCDGTADDGLPSFTFYADTDGDGYGDPATTVSACSTPTGYVAHDGDCDDTDATVNPGAMEDCSATDDMNCDGLVGADDNDGDGYGACEECDDADAAINPGATEVCGDGTDNDCDGTPDETDCEAPWVELPICVSVAPLGGGGYIALENRGASFATVQYGCGALTDGVGVAAGSTVVENPRDCSGTGYMACADVLGVWAYAY